jgi:uncharacterized damage-inducible protein DinB
LDGRRERAQPYGERRRRRRDGQIIAGQQHRVAGGIVATTDMLLPEFDHEAAVTRLLLERAPESRLTWTPHPRSWTLGELCVHLAHVPMWAAIVMQQPAFDLNPADGPPHLRSRFESHATTLRLFDDHVTQGRRAITEGTEAQFLDRWTLRDAGRTVFTMPRISVLRSFVLSHMIHHRGQLSVYLRLCDVPLPPIYGPTADSAAQEG